MVGGKAMDIQSLVHRAKEGDKEALVDLIIAQREDYYKIAYVYVENKEDALDAVSEMTVTLYQHISKLRNDELFYSWSKTILVNCCKAILRNRGKIVYFEEYHEGAKEDNYNVKEMRADILFCVKKLNSTQKEAIKLKYFMDLDYDSIAKIINAPLGTVKSRVVKGLARLKRCFGGEY